MCSSCGPSHEAILSVSDTGVGIASEFLPHVFEWFRQADAKSQSQSGLGLGLGIVRHLVQLHGGSVYAESAGEGRGATFTVRLPIYEPSAARPKPEPEMRAAQVGPVSGSRTFGFWSSKTTMTRANCCGRCSRARGRWWRASRAPRALAARFSPIRPDVLISDIRMPEENGYALMQSLRAAGIETPAIALTAYARREDALEAQAAGFQIHLPKPVDPGRLIDVVARLASRAS